MASKLPAQRAGGDPPGLPRRVGRSAASLLPPIRRLLAQRDQLAAALAESRSHEQSLREINDRLRSRLSQKGDRGTRRRRQGVPLGPSGQPLQFLFVITYGRSGSTLLQGILNSIPGYLIRGENGGVMYYMYQGHSTASRLQRKHGRRMMTPRNAMFGIGEYPKAVGVRELRHYALSTLLRPEKDTRVVGFKEIRWHQEDALKFVRFMRTAFPGARIVVNTRNLDEVSRSKWWGERDDSLEYLQDIEAKMLNLMEDLGDSAYRVHYNDYIAAPEKLRGLFDWLGEDFDLDRINSVLAERHSF